MADLTDQMSLMQAIQRRDTKALLDLSQANISEAKSSLEGVPEAAEALEKLRLSTLFITFALENISTLPDKPAASSIVNILGRRLYDECSKRSIRQTELRFLAILVHAYDTDSNPPSSEVAATNLSVHFRTIWRARKQLREVGFIDDKDRPTPKLLRIRTPEA